MATAPWAETPTKVVIEFKKANENCKRRVQLTHTRQQNIPPQLVGRVDAKAWDQLLAQCEQLAAEHPYIESANMDCCCNNLFACCLFLVVGFGCFQGDAGDYDVWLGKVQRMLAGQNPYFQQCGCVLSVQSVHGCFWVQVDVAGPPPGYGVPPQGYGTQPATMYAAPPMQAAQPY